MTSAHLTAMRVGRTRAARLRRRESIARVKAYRAWLRADAAYYGAKHLGLRIPPKPAMPEVPSDHDYRVSRGEA